MNKNILIAGTGVAALLVGLLIGKAARPLTNRGLRNNNVGNIRRTESLWVGEVSHEKSTDKSFKQFKNWTYGIRALIGLLHRYYYKYDKKTIRSIVSMYAPPFENHSEHYIQLLTKRIGIDADTVFEFNYQNILNLVKGMANVEIGGDYVKSTQFLKAWNLWLLAKDKP